MANYLRDEACWPSLPGRPCPLDGAASSSGLLDPLENPASYLGRSSQKSAAGPCSQRAFSPLACPCPANLAPLLSAFSPPSTLWFSLHLRTPGHAPFRLLPRSSLIPDPALVCSPGSVSQWANLQAREDSPVTGPAS